MTRCAHRLNDASAPDGLCPSCLFEAALRGEPDPEELPGDGKYRILNILDESEDATIYLAEQIEPIQQLVAMKVLVAGADAGDVLARLESLRQALVPLGHSGAVTMLETGLTADGRPYAVMDYVRGADITRYCDRARFSVRARIGLIADVCHIVEQIHQRGVVHGNIKPSTVRVSSHGGCAVPTLVGFRTPTRDEAPDVASDIRALGALLASVVETSADADPYAVRVALDSIDRRAATPAAAGGYQSASHLVDDLRRLV